MAFVLAVLVFIGTLAIAALMLFATYMSTTGQAGASPMPVLIGGTLLALAIAASHWLPHIGW